MPSEDLTKLPWYGGNKIPDSYLKKFSLRGSSDNDDLPYDLRLFLDGMGETKEPK